MAKLPQNAEILPPYDDRIFKTLLTHPDAKPALIDLVSACIGRNVLDVQVRNNELPTTDVDEKNERLDINCVLDNGDQVNVEMQSSRLEEIGDTHEGFLNKYIYYLTDLHSSQKSKGVKYIDLARTYQIVFSMYTVFPNITDYITESGIRTKDGRLISDQINMVLVELSKLENILQKSPDQMTPIEMWSIFLGHADNPEYRTLINDIIERKEVLAMASSVLTTISKDEHERAKFMSRRKAETDRVSNLLTAEERGRRLERVEFAARLLRRNRPINEIMEDTGLTLEEIQSLQK